jgi:glutamine amidotransferase
MIGFVSKKKVPLRRYFVSAPRSLLYMSLHGKKAPHRHGFGYLWKTEEAAIAVRRYGSGDLEKTPGALPDALPVASTLAIGHVRKASPIYRVHTGAREAHPFAEWGIFLAHNGTIYDADVLDPNPGIDSQKLARWLAHAWWPRTPEGLAKALERLLQEVQDFTAIDLLLTEGTNLYAFCCFNRNPDYYTLWYRATKDTIIISSEPVDEEPTWQPMKNLELLWSTPDLKVHRRQIPQAD